MCGIIGYIGNKNALPILLEGLRRLEYRGYDSAGVALLAPDGSRLIIERAVGKVAELEKRFIDNNLPGLMGIGHTRWATHGQPAEENAHPHKDCKDNIAVVHNGIIENYQELKNDLIKRGHKFLSQTDTEVIAHLLEDESEEFPLEKKLQNILPKIIGATDWRLLTKEILKKSW